MGWRDLWRSAVPPRVRRQAKFSAPSTRGLEWWIEQATRTDAPVSRQTALTVPAVVRGRNLICSISTLPLEQIGPGNVVGRLPLLEQFDPDIPNSVHLAQTVEDLLFDGIAWWRITAFGWDGYPVNVRRVDPCTVSLTPPNTPPSPAYLPSGIEPRGAAVWIDGVRVDGSEVIRFDSPNPPVLVAGARAIRKAILLDRAAAMHADGQIPSTYFEPAQGQDPSDEEIAEFLADWKAAVKKRATPWKPAFAQLQSLNLTSPRDLQLVELQKQSGLELANMFGIDPEDLGISTTSRTYQNDVDRRRAKINDTLMPYMLAVSDRLSMGDVTRRGYRVVFDVDGYLRSNPTERATVQKTYHDMGALTVDEIRADEGLPPLTAEQRAELAPPPPPPIMAEATVEDGNPTPQAISNSRELALTFDASGRARMRFDKASKRRPVKARFASSTTSAHIGMSRTTFAVNVDARTIEGIVVPWDQVGTNSTGRYRFARGSLQAPPVLTWNKMLVDHEVSQAVGRLDAAEDRPEGLWARYKVARGAEGDRALSLAEDGVLDGLSVGVSFERRDVGPDPLNKGVTLISRADWEETSLTAMPAFSAARTTRVVATKGEGSMPEQAPVTENPTEGTEPETGAVQLSTEAKQKMLASNPQLVEQAWKALTEPPAAPKPAAPALDAATFAKLSGTQEGLGILAAVYGVELPKPEPRAVVNPTRPTVQAAVKEAAPYRFDRAGRLLKGTHEFSADLIAARGGDQAAYDRSLEFVKAKFSDDPIAVADVDELNPTINQNRYIDERDYAYPLWSRLGKGAPPNGVQPFQWPLYSSSGIAVATHTAGTAQDSGDYQTTKQTVTPVAKSARTQIPREVWDMGGTPALSNLIWTKMLRSWGEVREAVIDAALDAAESSPGLTDLASFTAGGGTTGQTLSAEMEAALAGLHFIRGGHRFEFVATQIDLFKALASAKDGNKRALYAILGPQNANGQTGSRFGTIEIGGVTFVPSWAAAATGTVAAASYLIDPTAVDAWATAPNRLDFDKSVEYLEIAVWGYMAAAVVDTAGVMTISYDPVA